MMRNFDFSSWQTVLTSLIGLALFALIGVGIRLALMMTVQQRRERLNRQINERLKVLIAAYKVLGGSFTGNLAVDPTHLADLRRTGESESGSDRARRTRDAVEAALSDILLLGTEEQVRLAATAAEELAAGRPVHTRELVTSLRNFIREALDLDAVPAGLAIPPQGPARPAPAGGRGGATGREGGGGRSGGGGDGGGGGGTGGGMGFSVDPDDPPHR
jgi:uncharacterized membrane protein YgcG